MAKKERLAGSFGVPRHSKKNEANMKMIEVVLYGIGERILMLKARRDIVLFEQLRFDYGDKVAQAVFDHSS